MATKTLKFYKNSNENNWYLYIKWLPNFLTPLLQMVMGADRLLDILYLRTNNITKESDILEFYENKNKNMYIVECDVATKYIEAKGFKFTMKLNKYLNKEMKMFNTRDGRLYVLKSIDLYRNIDFLDNEKNQYFDRLGLGNNIWLCYVTWFVFWFRYPKTVIVCNIKASKSQDWGDKETVQKMSKK